VAAGAGAERAAGVIRAFAAFHGEALGDLRAEISARDAQPRRSTSDRAAGCPFFTSKLLRGLLLRRRKPLPQVAVEETVDRARSAGNLAPACVDVNRHTEILGYTALHPGYEKAAHSAPPNSFGILIPEGRDLRKISPSGRNDNSGHFAIIINALLRVLRAFVVSLLLSALMLCAPGFLCGQHPKKARASRAIA